jgi:hypothetical protein
LSIASAQEQTVTPPFQIFVREVSRQKPQDKRTIDDKLNQYFQFSFTPQSLRDVIYQLQFRSQIGFWIDPRIDPDQIITAHSKSESLAENITDLTPQIHAKWVIYGETIALIPVEADPLNEVLLLWKTQEYQTLTNSKNLPALQRRDMNWPLLSTPRNLCTQIADNVQIRIENPTAIPHDLWSPGQFFGLNALEQMTLILAPYQKTWIMHGSNSMEIMPIDPQRSLQLTYLATEKEKALFKTKEPKMATMLTNSKGGWQLSAPLSDHIIFQQAQQKLIATTLNTKPKTTIKPRKLNYTFSAQLTPARLIVDSLMKDGFPVRYDADALKKAKIKLDKPITISVKEATAQELVSAICDAWGTTFKLEGDIYEIISRP